MLQELMIALRRLAKRPRFAAPAVATLAVGIGATTAIFCALDAVVLRPLPYPDAEHLYTLGVTFPDGRSDSGRVSSDQITAINASAPSVVWAAGGITGHDVITGDDGSKRELQLETATPGFFDVFGLPMEVGRGCTDADTPVTGLGFAVLSHATWDQMFGRDPTVVGRTLRLAQGDVSVVGVAPPELDVPRGTGAWLCVTASPTSTFRAYDGYLRVRRGTTPERLRSELSGVMASLADANPEAVEGQAFVVRPFVSTIVGDLPPILIIVFGGASVLLAMACVNVTILLLARSNTEMRGFAIRQACGASRGRIVRELLADSFVLSCGGTALGLLLGYGSVRALLALGAARLPRLDDVGLDWGVFAFAAAVLVAVTVLVGLLPSRRLSAPDLGELLQRSGRSATRDRRSGRLLSGLIVAEIALSIVLVAGSGWLVRSYATLSTTDPGFAAEGRLYFEAMLRGSSFLPISRIVHGSNGPLLVPDRSGDTPRTWFDQLGERLRASGQVLAVGSASTLPFQAEADRGQVVQVVVSGDAYDPDTEQPSWDRAVSPGFFDAMGIRLVAGRTFAPDDPRTSVIVNEAFVRRYLPGRDPIGASFAWGIPTPDFDNLATIVGVVGDVRYVSLMEPDEPTFYNPTYDSMPMVVISTASDDPTSLIPMVQAAANAVDPAIPITVEPLQTLVSDELLRYRLGLVLMGLFAAVSLALAGVGIYGVIGHATAERSGEFAIRMALGARPRSILTLVMAQARTLWIVGTALGLSLAYVAGRVASGWLFGVRSSDPSVLIVAASAAAVLTFLAFLLPALQGSRVGPSELGRMS